MFRIAVFLVGLSILGGVVFHSILSTSEQIQMIGWLDNAGMKGVSKSLNSNTGDHVPGANELKRFTSTNPGFMDFLHAGLDKLGSAANRISGAMKGTRVPNRIHLTTKQLDTESNAFGNSGAISSSTNNDSPPSAGSNWNSGTEPGIKWFGGAQFHDPSKPIIHEVSNGSCITNRVVSLNANTCG